MNKANFGKLAAGKTQGVEWTVESKQPQGKGESPVVQLDNPVRHLKTNASATRHPQGVGGGVTHEKSPQPKPGASATGAGLFSCPVLVASLHVEREVVIQDVVVHRGEIERHVVGSGG